MPDLLINGPARLRGELEPGGNKNAVLPMIAAALLTDDDVILHNAPDILDVRNMLAVSDSLGVTSHRSAPSTLVIRADGLKQTVISRELSHLTRTSLLFAGPLAARTGEATLSFPGGDFIGRRRLDPHFYGLQKLGLELELSDDGFTFRRRGPLRGTELFLDEASVTATEHILMTACLAEGQTTIRNAACEPHVAQLADLLNTMGANIQGAGTNIIVVEGVPRLHGGEITIESDYVEVASYLALCAATGGSLEVNGNILPHTYWMTRRVFERFNGRFTVTPGHISFKSEAPLTVAQDFNHAIPVIADGPWPQFPSDMMSCFIALATQASGTVLFFEKMFESRLYFVDKLIAMGANAIVCDPHRVVISGPSRLHGVEMTSPDIRAGMAMVIAACCAHGQSRISRIDMVKRGYANLTAKLQALGLDCEEI